MVRAPTVAFIGPSLSREYLTAASVKLAVYPVAFTEADWRLPYMLVDRATMITIRTEQVIAKSHWLISCGSLTRSTLRLSRFASPSS